MVYGGRQLPARRSASGPNLRNMKMGETTQKHLIRFDINVVGNSIAVIFFPNPEKNYHESLYILANRNVKNDEVCRDSLSFIFKETMTRSKCESLRDFLNIILNSEKFNEVSDEEN